MPLTPQVHVFDTANSRSQKLCEALQSKYKDSPADAIKKVFAVFDKDGNGLLEADEIKAMVDVLFPTASQSVKDAKLKHADANEDGKISMSEFLDTIWPTK